MTSSHNHEAARRRVVEQFQATTAREGLTVREPLGADELLSEYGDRVVTISQEAFRHDSREKASDWVETCVRQIGFNAVVLVNQQNDLVGFAGAALSSSDKNDMEVAAHVVQAQRRASGIDTVIYSNALAIASEERRKGLGLGLAVVATQICREQIHPGGALLFYRTRPENQTANRASQELGAQPTEIISPNSGKRLWYVELPPAEANS